mgnify:CR=1 FL=1
MKKLDLKLGSKNELSKEQMKKITGGYMCGSSPYYYECANIEVGIYYSCGDTGESCILLWD